MSSFKPPTLTSSTTVRLSPSTPTPPELRHLPLSHLDCVEIGIFTPVLLLYRPPDTDFQVLVANLKESLREALVVYYPFAGRLVKKEEPNGEPEVRCDDSGCFFTEAVVEETLEEVGGEGCVGLSGMEAAGLSGDGVFSLEEYEEIPPLVIQMG